MSAHPFHAVSELFPLMTGAPFDELVADIKANGLRESIWRHDGKIIDGRNRYLACEKAGVEPTFREWAGNENELVKFIISLNLHRRHLSESQRSSIGGKISTRPHGNQRSINCAIVPTAEEAAEMLNVGVASIYRAKKVHRDGSPEVVAAVDSGELSLHMAKQIVDVPKEKQGEEMAKRRRLKGVRTKTRSYPGRKAPEAIRSAIGTLVGLASGLDSFKAKDAAPTPEEAEQWERDLAIVVSAINRFRRQLKEHVNG